MYVRKNMYDLHIYLGIHIYTPSHTGLRSQKLQDYKKNKYVVSSGKTQYISQRGLRPQKISKGEALDIFLPKSFPFLVSTGDGSSYGSHLTRLQWNSVRTYVRIFFLVLVALNIATYDSCLWPSIHFLAIFKKPSESWLLRVYIVQFRTNSY